MTAATRSVQLPAPAPAPVPGVVAGRACAPQRVLRVVSPVGTASVHETVWRPAAPAAPPAPTTATTNPKGSTFKER